MIHGHVPTYGSEQSECPCMALRKSDRIIVTIIVVCCTDGRQPRSVEIVVSPAAPGVVCDHCLVVVHLGHLGGVGAFLWLLVIAILYRRTHARAQTQFHVRTRVGRARYAAQSNASRRRERCNQTARICAALRYSIVLSVCYSVRGQYRIVPCA